MTRVHRFHPTVYPRKSGIILLAAMMFLGCIAGIWLSCGARDSFADAATVLSVPAAGIAPVMVLLLPLVLSALAVYIQRPVFLLPLAFWKAFFFSYVFAGFMGVWGGGGWLVSSLGLFSGICSLPVLCRYWLRHIGGAGFSFRTFLPALAMLILIRLADLQMISPFLADILIS